MDFGRITGWIAISLIAISFCTSVRSPRLNSLIGGYRFQIRLHHGLGVAATASMIAHLAILTASYWSSLSELLEITDSSLLSGWIAFISCAIVVAVAFGYRSAPYRRWRKIHLVLILGFLAGVLHSFLVLEPRTIGEWASIASLVLTGGIGMVWTLWIPRLQTFGAPYVIAQQRILRPDLVLQTLTPVDRKKPLHFTAGQFIFLRYDGPQFSKMWHPFTVVGFSNSDGFELLVKARGRDTNLLHDLTLPSTVRINGPFGESFWRSDEPQVWIAYGVGIAIFLAAARTLPSEFKSKVRFIYCEKNPERVVFNTEFDGLSATRKNFSWAQYFGEGPDVITQLGGVVPAWPKTYRLFRICGHPGFQAAVKDLLITSGVSSDEIILEGVF